MNKIFKNKIDNAPLSPGIYYLKNKQGQIIYIGKAARLRNRLRSYSKKDQENARLKSLISKIKDVDWKTTATEIEALLKESQEIKKIQPFFNVLLKDDKRYFYVVFTKDPFPKVKITHQPNKKGYSKVMGPFTSGPALKRTMKSLRKIVPFCTCKAYHNKPCANSQIGLCPAYCCLKETLQSKNLKEKQQEYKKLLKRLENFLTGKISKVKKELQKEMSQASQQENFEEAQRIKAKIEAFDNILSHQYIFKKGSQKKTFKIEKYIKFLDILKAKEHPKRWEAYDLSNLKGSLASGSMIVFSLAKKKNYLNYKPNKSDYRIFNVKTVKKGDDLKMLKEVLRRRSRHLPNKKNQATSWQAPDALLIDGGKTHLKTALKQIKKYNYPSPLIVTALAKQQEKLYTVLYEKGRDYKIHKHFLDSLPQDIANFFKNLRNEAHRFALKQHRKLRKKSVNF